MNAAPKLNPTTFEAFWHLGYGPRLLPIIPPNAEVASQDARGEVPGIKGHDGKWHSLDWQHHETRPADIELWTPMQSGIGCRTGDGLVAIDAATLDTALAGLILTTVFKHFSVMPTRTGNWPETLYLIRISGPFPHARVEFGNKERVEVLAEGNYAVFAGTHPKTPIQYTWPFPPVPFDQLPIVTPHQLTDFLNDLALILPAAKLVITEGAGKEVSQASLHDELSAVRKVQDLAEQHVRNSARLKQKALCTNSPAPGTGGSETVSPLAEEIAALVDRGYLRYLRPCAPPAVELHTRRGLKLSDGKLPSTYLAGKWFGLPAWLTYEPKPTDVLEWSAWPGAGLCLVTGDVCAFDIDIKFAWGDESDAAKHGRRCISEIIKTIAAKVGCEAKGMPIRGRANSTSCAFFVRLDSRIEKQVVTLFEAGSERRHKVEFLASGQQIVIAGMHESGVRVKSSLAEFALDRIPTISADTLQAIMGEISAVAQRHGYATEKKAPQQKRALGAMKPDLVVAREIMRRRAEWVPSVVPCSAGTGDREWRIRSTDLDRDLEEDLCIYTDGIFDHGTERSHTVISFIREFGAIEAGEISFGGCPRYGRRGKVEFAAIGEFEPAPRRPTEAEALNWLCHQLAGEAFPALPADTTWSKSWRAVAAAVDLDWRALEALHVNLLFDDIDEAGTARPFDPSGWSAEDLKRNARLLPAIRATDPDWFAKLEFAWDLTGATSSAEVSAAIVKDATRVREHVTATGYAGIFEQSPPLAPTDAAEFSEPLDIFGDVDPAELSDPPPGSFPPVIERWARSEARRKGVPYIFAAAAAIGAASSAVGSSLRICPRVYDDGWLEPAALWLALVADPGSAKSPIISAAIEPLRRLDSERGKADQARHDAWAAAAKKKGKDNPDPGREPVVRRSVVDDVTMERQVRIHADNPRGLLRAPDELFGLFGSLGAYKKGADGDRSQVLRLFEGKEVTVDRVGAGSIRADKALMGIVAGTQPEKLKTLVRDLSDDGMLQRFIFILHDGKERQGIDEPPDREALASYARTMKGLASAEYAYCPPIKLSADGYGALAEMNRRIASLKSIPATAAAWRGHVEKWGKFLPRLVLTFHALEEFSDFGAVDPENEVRLATVRRAISFARFLLIRHSLRFYETYFGASEAANEAREIAGFVLSKGASLTDLTRKTVYDARKDLRGPRNLPALLAAMRELENANWCAVTDRQADGPTRWRVNPVVHTRFDERAVWERTNRAERQRRIIEAGKQRQEWSRMDGVTENETETGFEGSK